ncbi:MAG: NAD/NADP octopine/nopaline dehydrogenase family protein [Vampirovibrio sp.]|nr:NAD/NADP octopine/nopaline dehydrogenase family protein [Vampirovibrio sp.]
MAGKLLRNIWRVLNTEIELNLTVKGGVESGKAVLEMAKAVSSYNYKNLKIALLETSPYGGRMTGEVHAKRKSSVDVAVFPKEKTQDVIGELNQLFPLKNADGQPKISFRPVSPVEIILGGQNYIYHVAVTLDAANLLKSIHTVFPSQVTRVSSQKLKPQLANGLGEDSYNHYLEGITPEIAEIMEALDKERLDIARAFGIQMKPLNECLNTHYCIGNHQRFYDAFQACKNVYNSKVPIAKKLALHRFVVEDLPSINIIEALGRIANVPTPVTSAVKEVCYWNAQVIGAKQKSLKGYDINTLNLPETTETMLEYLENPSEYLQKQQKDKMFLKKLVPIQAKS